MSQLEEGDKQYVYAQRFVDPSTCEDLVPIKKQVPLFEANKKKSGVSVIQSSPFMNRRKHKRRRKEKKRNDNR